MTDPLQKFPSFISRTIHIGNLALGGLNPVRIQSMTSTNTLNTKETVDQSIRMIDAGCEMVRITCPGIKEAENLRIIKKELQYAGYTTPLIADIHFNPNVAEHAARIVEKIRINPGNYTGTISKNLTGLSEFEYQLELEKAADKLLPLLKICKEYGTVIRVGVNHGSLSERIIHKYGNTPAGMVASALEFIQICQAFQFRNLVLSMKSSNIKIMVQAYRLLASKMVENDMDYPLHLGVTEAGNGLDGRIKSTAGIGTLIQEGIGDTIRVSLTEAPENEIIFAKSMLKVLGKPGQNNINIPEYLSTINPYEYHRRKTHPVAQIGGGKLSGLKNALNIRFLKIKIILLN
jgi:(E)-4-hydroxy-3-methylbut-2-enyl-diphosphate synthase